MREILFRGKRVDNGEWETGGFATTFKDCSNEKVYITDKMTGFLTEVQPETVCQYTGLKDRNGTKIFEGDIVVCRYANEYTPVFQNGIYMAYNPNEMQTIQQPSTQFNIIWRNGCEVIGTKFDVEVESESKRV